MQLTLFFVFAALAPALAVPALYPPKPNAPVVVFAAPWQSAIEVVEEAGGSVVLPGRYRFVALALPAEQTSGIWLRLGGGISDVFCVG